MRDALEEGHLVFRILDVVNSLDISCVTDRMEERDPRGDSALPPADDAGVADVRVLLRDSLVAKDGRGDLNLLKLVKLPLSLPGEPA